MPNTEKQYKILRSILGGINAFIVVTVPETCEILFVNEWTKKAFGIKGDITGQYCYRLFQEGQTERCGFCPYHQLEQNPESVITWERYESRINKTHRKTAVLIDWPGGRKAHLEYGLDITENIEQREALGLALKAAQSANSAKNEFLSRMSHEMRTPMNAIIGMTALGKKADGQAAKDYAFEKIHEASGHLMNIINDILDFAKIEANKLELASEVFAFNDMIKKAVSFVQYTITEKKQKFTAEISGGVPDFAVGDEQHLAQVVINLLSNAVKFTPEGGEITLRVELLDFKGDLYHLRFEVADSGIGIPPEQHGKVFLAFEQAEGGANRKYGGTGLGLPISKRIVEKMGGSMSVTSAPGEGSRFIFTVQLQYAEAPRHIVKEETAEEEADNFAGKRILIAEDIAVNREIMIELLRDTGVEIDVAENGVEASDMIIANPMAYDLVLMDVQMPEMDGLDATRRVRAAGLANIPIIAMTANVYREDIEDCISAGMDGHIGKPLDFVAVLEKLREYLK